MSGIVKRQLEVNDVVRLWKQICQGDARTTLREFYGIPGIGKTELAKQIRSALKSERALCAHLDFDPVQNPWGNDPKNKKVWLYYDRPGNLFEDLLTGWDYLNSPDLREKLSPDAGVSTFELQQFAQQVVELVKALPPDKTVVLICDETDHIKWERLTWFERDLIAPLAKSDHCLIIWLGRQQKQWPAELASIKVKAESSLLEPFSPSEIDVQLKLGGVTLAKEQEDNLLNWLYDMTQGHPMAVEVAIGHYSQSISKEEVFQGNLEIVKDITERVLKGYILRDNPLQFSEALKLSLLRIVDASLLRALVGNPSDSLLSYGKLVIELMANPLGDCKERLLKKSVAIWLHHYFRISDPKGYLEKQEALLQECIRLCKVVMRSDWSRYVLESVYHAACANRVTEKYDLLDILRAHLQNLRLSEMADDSESLIMELDESFRSDKELEEYIGQDGADQLIAILEDERKRL